MFSAARWSLDAVGLAVFDLIAAWFEGDVLLALDDTLARKRGLKMFGCGMHHDPLLSSRGKAVMNWGHSWVVLGVIVELPFRPGHYFCLPILFRLYLNKAEGRKAPPRLSHAAGVGRRDARTLCSHRKTSVFTSWPTVPTAARACFEPSAGQLRPDQPPADGRATVRRAA